MSEKIKEYRLPAREEESMIAAIEQNYHGRQDAYRFGWMRGRVYACSRIADFVKIKGYFPSTKKDILELIDFIIKG